MPFNVSALAAARPDARLELTTIERRDPGPHDVVIDIAYTGICHTDIALLRNHWMEASSRWCPGHEITGTVTAAGSEVTRYTVGDRVGVGCYIDSCRECENCLAGEEQHCLKGEVLTFGGRDYDGNPTYGGYSRQIVVDENYVLRIPAGLALAAAAPLLCGGEPGQA
jgi:uncharacterized zinc-type alcohol dehydrogenase-like protein